MVLKLFQKIMFPFLLSVSIFYSTFSNDSFARNENYAVFVNARSFYNSCSHFSVLNTEIEINYLNTQLPWGTQINLIWGNSGFEEYTNDQGEKRNNNFSWESRKEEFMSAVAGYTWQSKINQVLYAKGSNHHLLGIDFVFKVTLPGGQVYYDNGYSTGTWGYFHINAPESTGCYGRPDYQPKYSEVDVSTVYKD